MTRTALLVAAAVALLVAVALVLVPFEAHLATEAPDGTSLRHTVDLQCRAPLLDGLGIDPVGDDGAPRPCVGRSRLRLSGGVAAGLAGTALLSTGLRRPRRLDRPRPVRNRWGQASRR